jgi:hypothetical protein
MVDGCRLRHVLAGGSAVEENPTALPVRCFLESRIDGSDLLIEMVRRANAEPVSMIRGPFGSEHTPKETCPT